ncbi:MAG: Spy/CpxP family protein refolding chaperone [Beijerinckiaceae bacterium]|nr:Spy/CpxP family protein refolding chaperone [Beijerinckiaceae bacterium]
MSTGKTSRRGLVIGGLAAAAVIVGVGVAASQPWGGGGHGMGGMSGPFMNMRAEWGVNRMLDRLDATPEQKTKVSAIVKSALADLEPMRASASTIRADAARLLKADVIDRAEIEKLRAQRIAQADAASKRFTQAFADAAEVLTPKQRAELVGRMEGFAFGRGMAHGGMGQGIWQGMGHGPGEGRGYGGPGWGGGSGR